MRRAVRFLAILILVGFPASPQLFKLRSVSGVVTDKRGNELRGAAVLLENTNTLSVSSYITGKDGRYHFNLLHDDIDYTLKAKYRNYESESRTVSKFSSSTHHQINLVIPIE